MVRPCSPPMAQSTRGRSQQQPRGLQLRVRCWGFPGGHSEEQKLLFLRLSVLMEQCVWKEQEKAARRFGAGRFLNGIPGAQWWPSNALRGEQGAQCVEIAALEHPLDPVNRTMRSEGHLQSWGTKVLLRALRLSMVKFLFRLFYCGPIPILTTQAVSRTKDSTPELKIQLGSLVWLRFDLSWSWGDSKHGRECRRFPAKWFSKS